MCRKWNLRTEHSIGVKTWDLPYMSCHHVNFRCAVIFRPRQATLHMAKSRPLRCWWLIFAYLVTHCWVDVLRHLNAYPFINNEPQMWKEVVVAYFRGTIAAFVDRTGDSHKNVRSGYRFPGQVLNTEPPEYKAECLPLTPHVGSVCYRK
jgi:hypothetical protein